MKGIEADGAQIAALRTLIECACGCVKNASALVMCGAMTETPTRPTRPLS